VFTYRVYDEDGEELGKAAYTQRIKPGRRSGCRALEPCGWSTSSRLTRATTRGC
jgi:hypothetical protein